MSNTPLITIITVCYNAINSIEKTILSVINQTYNSIEYIIIDGGSTDGTIDIIQKYKNKVSHILSESDKGIYDAMNKGIKLATGEWINFMNCGDTFYNFETIQIVAEKISSNKHIDVLYGNSVIKVNNTKYMVLPENLECISTHLPFCHQSTFVRTALAKTYPFDITYRFVADYNFFYQIYNKKHKFQYINEPLSYYQIASGFTASNAYLCFLETTKINNQKITLIKKISSKFRSYILNIIPEKITGLIRLFLYNNNNRFIKFYK